MHSVSDIQVEAPITGLRMHSRHAAAGSPAAARVATLLDLKEREVRRATESKLLQELALAARAVVEHVPAAVGTRLDEFASLAVELGLAIARELVGTALEKGLVDPTPTVARCLRDCVHGSERTELVLRLHPQDLDLVQGKLATMPELQDELAAARFVGDHTVPRGGVRAETEAGRLRYDPKEALERVCAEVRREALA